MKVYLAADMAGTAGVSIWDQVDPRHSKYQSARRWLTQEVNAAADGAFAAGVELVIVHDLHGTRHNLDLDLLDRRVEAVMGTGPSPWAELDSSFEVMLLVGAHARVGTPDACLRHTWRADDWVDFRIQGRTMGEIGLYAAGAGDLGVPCALVTGDDKACTEAARLIPGIVQAPVKKGLGGQSARSLTPAAARELIRAKAQEACRTAKMIQPLMLEGDEIEIEIVRLAEDLGPGYAAAREADELRTKPLLIRRGRGHNVPEAFASALAAPAEPYTWPAGQGPTP